MSPSKNWGGKRPGAGRPVVEGEKRTSNLAGVRVAPMQLAVYKLAASRKGMTFSQWVTKWLDLAAKRDAKCDVVGQCSDELLAALEALGE